MAGPSPGSLVSSGQNGSLHNVLFYLPQNGNGNQFANEACHNQHGGTLNHLSYMQTSHNRYRPDPGLNKVHCFPSDNPYSCDRDTNGSYWSYQQQQWNQWNQNDYNHSESLGFKSCWMQQQQQQTMQQRQAIQNNNPSCMGFNPQYNHMHQQQQQQLQHLHQQQIQPQQQQHLLQQSGYRNNVMATVTVQSSAGSSQSSLSRTPSRCDSVRSESTCESHCSSSLSGGSSAGIEDMTGQQQYGMYQNFSSVPQLQQQQQQAYPQPHLPQHQEHVQQQMQHQQQQQQQCFWPSSHYDVQQQEQQQQQMDYFRQQQQMQQQQQHYYRQHQVIQQQQQVNCYWPRESPPACHQQPQQQQQQHRQFTCVNPAVPAVDHQPIVIETPACSSSPIVADTTTSMISSSPLPVPSSSSPPVTSHYNHPATPVESMECVPALGCDPPAGITATDESIESSSSVDIANTAADANANVNTTTTTIVSATTTSVPAGWTREISAGCVIYISPSGCRLSSLNDAANYVQRNGTCKCGLPCPLRLPHVFNFDPSVASNSETSLEARPTCCHKKPQDGTTDKTTPTTSAPTTTVTTATSKAAVKRKKSGNGTNSKTGKTLKPLAVVQQPVQQPHQQALLFRRSPCPNVDVRQIPLEQNRPPTGSLLPQTRPTQATTGNNNNNGPTFFEDPSAYLAQQTVLLQSSLQNSGTTSVASPVPESTPAVVAAPTTAETAEAEQTQEELLGDLLDCIPDSMEEVLDRQKDVAAAAEAAAQAEKAANLVKQAAAAAAVAARQQQQQQTATAQQQTTTTTQQKSHKLPSVPVSLAPAPAPIRSKPPPLAIRPATPASAARSRARAAETTSKSTKSRSPRRTHHQPIQIQSNAKVLQPAQLPQQQLQQQQQQQQQFIHQQQQHQFWPALSAPNIGPLRTASFPFVSYHSAVGPATATPIFSTAALRPGNLPMTFLTSAATHPANPAHATNVFNQALPVLTTRPALGPSGQVVHVLTTPGPMLAAAPLATEPSNAVPILTVGPMNPTNHPNNNNNNNNNNNSRGLTRTGKKRKSTPQTVASILQQGAQLAAMTQQQLHQPQQQQQHHHQATTLTLSQEPLLYNVQNFQQIQPQQTIQTLALMPDGKTYVVVNSQPAPVAPQPTHQQNTGGHWLLSPRPANIAPAGQPVNVFCTTQTGPGGATTFVLNGASAPTHQVLQLQDGTLVQTTTTEQPNLLANYGGLFIRCPSTPNGAQIFSTTSPAAANVRTIPLPIPIAPGRSPGRSPDSSSILPDGGMVTSSSTTNTGNTSLVACGEATPPSQTPSLSASSSLAVRTAHPSPVVQSSQIDSCVQEVETDQQHAQQGATEAAKSKSVTIEFNNNNSTTATLTATAVQHWLKPDMITNASQIVAG